MRSSLARQPVTPQGKPLCSKRLQGGLSHYHSAGHVPNRSLTIYNKTICVGTHYECQQRRFIIRYKNLIEEFDHGSD